MKVGTDGVLLGSWCTPPGEGGRALDIGTGTGLIALMIAQRTHNVFIDAIEIDKASFHQARENFQDSEWRDRIHVIHSSFQKFAKKNHIKYELLVCNPPFFKNSWRAPSHQRNLARHDDYLNPAELMEYSSSILDDKGVLSIIIPYERLEEIQYFAGQNNLKQFRIANVRPVPGRAFKRAMVEFSKTDRKIWSEEITIEEGGRHKYSKRYLDLTREFYL